jgi:hypothetical protein
MDASKKGIRRAVAGIQKGLKKLGETLIGIARFDERLADLDRRVTAHVRCLVESQQACLKGLSLRNIVGGSPNNACCCVC